MTWHNHIHGNEEHNDLLPELSQRSGLVQKHSKVMPADKLRTITNGIFTLELLDTVLVVSLALTIMQTVQEDIKHSQEMKVTNSK